MTSDKQKRACVNLPWPDRVLHPNARPHWGAKARAVKKARKDAGWAAKAAGIGRIDAEALRLTITFSPPNSHAHDLDGLVSSIKSYLDGIADVVGVDDRNWRLIPVKTDARPLGNVHILIEAVDAWEHIGDAASRVLSAIPVPKRGAA